MAHAKHRLFRQGGIIGEADTPWNGVHPPKFGKVGDGRDGWCKVVEDDLTAKAKDGDIMICEFSVIQTDAMWATEAQHDKCSTLIKNYWHRVAGVFGEVTAGQVKVIATLKRRKSIKGDPSGEFYVRVPGSNDGYRDENDEAGKRRIFATRQKARQYCRNAAASHDGEMQIVHPCGGIETFEWDGTLGGSGLSSVARMQKRGPRSLTIRGTGMDLEEL